MSRIYNADTTHKDGKAELHVGLIDEDEFIVERIDNKIEFRNAVTNDKISIRGAGIRQPGNAHQRLLQHRAEGSAGRTVSGRCRGHRGGDARQCGHPHSG